MMQKRASRKTSAAQLGQYFSPDRLGLLSRKENRTVPTSLTRLGENPSERITTSPIDRTLSRPISTSFRIPLLRSSAFRDSFSTSTVRETESAFPARVTLLTLPTTVP